MGTVKMNLSIIYAKFNNSPEKILKKKIKLDEELTQILRFPPLILSTMTLITRWIPKEPDESKGSRPVP